MESIELLEKVASPLVGDLDGVPGTVIHGWNDVRIARLRSGGHQP
jgi:hypothetical protein